MSETKPLDGADMIDVKPEDSVSQTGKDAVNRSLADKEAANGSQVDNKSTTSSTLRIRAMAEKAAMEAEMEALRQRQELELQEMKLKQKKAELELSTKLKILEAQERVYAEHRSDVSSSRHVQKSHLGNQNETLPYPLPSESTEKKPTPETHESKVLKPKSTCGRAASSDCKHVENNPSAAGTSEKDLTGIVHMLQQGQHHQQQMLDAMRLPHTELMYYDGNPLKFWEFWRAFCNTVDCTSVSDSIKLGHLYNHCVGEARRVIDACMVMDPIHGYRRAKGLLADRYGNSFKIADAWMRKITEGKKIHYSDKVALREFADELGVCLQTLQAMGHEGELSHQSVLLRIVQQLPNYLHGKWLRAVSSIRKQYRLPQIEDLVEFVQEAADEANDPVYGRLTDYNREPLRSSNKGGFKSDFKSSNRNKGNFSTSVTQPQRDAKVCRMCQGDHSLFGCTKFKEMDPEQRFKFAKDERLCYNCLVPGHMSSQCRIDRTCTVKGCNRKHTKFLHTTATAPQQGSTSTSATQTEHQSSHASCDATGAGRYRVALPIVPVRVWVPDEDRTVDTLALLDNGSTNSFCTQELADSLKAKGKQKTLTVSTIEKANSKIKCSAVNLKIMGTMTQKEMNVQMHTRPSLNISTENMVTEADISGLPHLQGLQLPDCGHTSVKMLIGQDVPEALVPLEVRAGTPGEAYAVRTVLGWTLNGPLGPRPQESIQASSSYISYSSEVAASPHISTRSPHKLQEKTRWVPGPELLLEGKEKWPADPTYPEVKPDKCEASEFNAHSSDARGLDDMINHYSSWHKLKRGVTLIRKFIRWMKTQKSLEGQELADFRRISHDEMRSAEEKILRHVQLSYFPEEIAAMEDGAGVKKNSCMYKLDPRMEEGLIRVGGRLSKSALPQEAKHPIILPKASQVSHIILRELHENLGHSGRYHVLAVLREKYWLLGAGAAVRSTINKCVTCRQQRARIQKQKMADFPKSRLTPDNPPFTRVGMDYFDGKDVYTRGRWRQVQYLADVSWKRWRKEYLPQLQERGKWASARRNMQQGDLVLVVDENAPRNSWLLGRVLETMPDRRGLVRSVKIKTKNSVLTRPIAKLCLILEADS